MEVQMAIGKKILFVILLYINQLTAISIKDIKQNYMYGLGQATNLQQADKRAINDLISQISVQVESSFTNIMEEKNGNLNEYCQSIIRTYSGSTLHNAQRKVIEKDNQTIVYRYIKKEELPKIFSNRKKKIINYTKAAVFAEQELRIGDALRYYYWALVLLRSHPEHDEISYNFGNQNQLLITALPNRISKIFADLDISISSIEDKMLVLQLNYQNLPVQNLDYDFWSGTARSRLHSAKNGIGTAELEQKFDNLKLRVEYIYQNKSRIDIELWQVLNETNLPTFASANFNIPVGNYPQNKQIRRVLVKNSIVGKVKNILSNIDNIELIKDDFTNEGFTQFQKIIGYGKTKFLSNESLLKSIKMGEKEIVSGAIMSFFFPENNRDFVENLTFTLDKSGKISEVNFSLSDVAIADIMNKSEKFGTVQDKLQIIHFIEQYKTAYSLRNIDFIEKVFSENALIIVGNVLKQDKSIEKMYKSIGDKIEYVKYSKQEYVKRLKMIFDSNEYVNIHFEDNKIRKSNRSDKVYGIQISQSYYSQNYADKGYLFLMFDLTDSQNPKIYVRTWQPKKDKNGKIFGLSDFKY